MVDLLVILLLQFLQLLCRWLCPGGHSHRPMSWGNIIAEAPVSTDRLLWSLLPPLLPDPFQHCDAILVDSLAFTGTHSTWMSPREAKKKCEWLFLRFAPLCRLWLKGSSCACKVHSDACFQGPRWILNPLVATIFRIGFYHLKNIAVGLQTKLHLVVGEEIWHTNLVEFQIFIQDGIACTSTDTDSLK